MKYLTKHLLILLISINPLISEMLYYDEEIPNNIMIPNDKKNYVMDKKQNLIVYGIPASEQQDQKRLVRAVLKIFQMLKINVNVDHVLIIKRLGKTLTKSTAVLVHFETQTIRLEALKRKDMLKGTGYDIALDVPKVISYRYRLLQPLCEKLIRQGANATIVWGKLYVDGKIVPDNVLEKHLFSTRTTMMMTVPQHNQLDYSGNG